MLHQAGKSQIKRCLSPALHCSWVKFKRFPQDLRISTLFLMANLWFFITNHMYGYSESLCDSGLWNLLHTFVGKIIARGFFLLQKVPTRSGLPSPSMIANLQFFIANDMYHFVGILCDSWSVLVNFSIAG